MLYLYLWLRSWLNRDEGQDLAEYALLIGLIALVVVAALLVLGPIIRDKFFSISSSLAP